MRGVRGDDRGAPVDGRRGGAGRRRPRDRPRAVAATSRRWRSRPTRRTRPGTENLAELVAVAREFSDDPVAGPSADPADVDAGFVDPGLGRLPRAGLAGGRHRPDPRRRGRRRHPDDAAHRQGPRVPGRVPQRARGRDLPALPLARGPTRARGGAPAGVRRPDPGPRAALRLPGAGPLGVGRPVAQPRVPVPRRAAGRPGRLAPYRGRADGLGAARLERRATPARGARRSARRPPAAVATSRPPPRAPTPSARPRRRARSPSSPRGTRSPTTRFGLGTVVATEGEGEKAVASIDFGSEGVKRLLLRYAPVEKL